jgi:hypothetical protein
LLTGGTPDRLTAAGVADATPVDYEERKPLNLGYANIARFRHAVAPSLVSTIDMNRDTDFNEVSFDTVELVRSDKVLSERNTETLARFRLS